MQKIFLHTTQYLENLKKQKNSPYHLLGEIKYDIIN